MNKRNTKISVIIPTYNRPVGLADCLERIANQTIGVNYEVIVIDDNSDCKRKIEEVVNSCGIDKVRLIRSNDNAGPAAARNRGSDVASGEFIVFTDDDTLPDEDWLAELYDCLSSGADAVEGRVTPTTEKTNLFDDVIRNEGGESYLTANFAVRRSVFNEIGGFHEEFKSAHREDSDLAFCLIENGTEIVFEQEAVVEHPVESRTFFDLATENDAFKYDILLFKRHPELYIKHIKAPFKLFTPFYLAMIMLLPFNYWLIFSLPILGIAEAKTYNREWNYWSVMKYSLANSIGSVILTYNIVVGCLQFNVNPISLYIRSIL